MRAESLFWAAVTALALGCGGTDIGDDTVGSFGGGDDDDSTSSSGSSGNGTRSGGGASSGGSSGSSSGGGGSTSSGGSSGEAPGGTLGAGDTTWSISAAGRQRSVRVHVPAAIGERKLPVVIALHGNGDDAANFEATSGLRGQSDALGFVLLVPDGIARNVSVGGQTAPNVPWDAYNLYDNNWDLQLMTALRERVQETGSVQNAKVSIYGFSQGGYMAYRTANALANDFACAAVLGASDPAGYPVSFARKIPLSLQIGSNDYAIDQAKATDAALSQAGHDHQWDEVAGLGHAMAPAPRRFAPLTYCLDASL